jgi:hypothetical protein
MQSILKFSHIFPLLDIIGLHALIAIIFFAKVFASLPVAIIKKGVPNDAPMNIDTSRYVMPVQAQRGH